MGEIGLYRRRGDSSSLQDLREPEDPSLWLVDPQLAHGTNEHCKDCLFVDFDTLNLHVVLDFRSLPIDENGFSNKPDGGTPVITPVDV